MIGNLAFALNVFEARGGIGENRGQQIVGTHALDLRRNFLASLKAQQRKCAASIPAPARAKNRRVQSRLLENRLHRFRLQEMKNIAQRETVLLSQGDVETVVGGRGLQFKIKTDTKTFAQC